MEHAHAFGVVSRLWRYPIKALQAEPLARAELEDGGIAGDRRRALFVSSADHPRSGKTFRGKEHRLMHTVRDPAQAQALLPEGGVLLQERTDGPYFDAQPISIVVDCWLAEAERLVGLALDPLRFRPNVFVRSAAGFDYAEADLVKCTLSINGVRLAVEQPIIRGLTPSYDVATGRPDARIQRALVAERNNIMGVYCRVVAPGTIAVGDRILVAGPAAES